MSRLSRVIFGTWPEPMEYRHWTRHLVVRPALVGGSGGLAGAIAAIAASASGASFGVMSLVGVAGIIAGCWVAGLLWLRWEKRNPQTPG